MPEDECPLTNANSGTWFDRGLVVAVKSVYLDPDMEPMRARVTELGVLDGEGRPVSANWEIYRHFGPKPSPMLCVNIDVGDTAAAVLNVEFVLLYGEDRYDGKAKFVREEPPSLMGTWRKVEESLTRVEAGDD